MILSCTYLGPFILNSYLYKIIMKFSFTFGVLYLQFFYSFLIDLFWRKIEVYVFSLDVA